MEFPFAYWIEPASQLAISFLSLNCVYVFDAFVFVFWFEQWQHRCTLYTLLYFINFDIRRTVRSTNIASSSLENTVILFLSWNGHKFVNHICTDMLQLAYWIRINGRNKCSSKSKSWIYSQPCEMNISKILKKWQNGACDNMRHTKHKMNFIKFFVIFFSDSLQQYNLYSVGIRCC